MFRFETLFRYDKEHLKFSHIPSIILHCSEARLPSNGDWVDAIEKDPAEVSPKHRKLVEFQRDLNTELGKVFATKHHPYDQFYVFLLCWQTADPDNLLC